MTTPAAALYSARQRWLFLSILFAVATSNYVDRYIIAVLLEPIKREFGVSDTLLGLLSGASFALLYAVMGIPVARWADRGDGRWIIVIALSLWSLMTALCGAAQSFWQLALARVGVGIGEAGAAPPTQSLLVDCFPPEQRGRAMSILTAATTAGYLLAFMGGAALVVGVGWRWTLLIVALPGLQVALIAAVMLKEPRAQLGWPSKADANAESLLAALRVLWRKPSYRSTLCALTLWAFFAYGAVLFVPSYLVRALQVDFAVVGLAYGLVSAAGALIGTLGGWWLIDRLAAHDRAWLLRLPALAMLVGTPFYLASFLIPSFWAFLLLGGIGATLVAAALPATFVAAHAVCGSKRRAMEVAILLFFMSLIGAALGPVATGLVSDWLQPRFGAMGLGYALALMSLSMPAVAMLLFSPP